MMNWHKDFILSDVEYQRLVGNVDALARVMQMIGPVSASMPLDSRCQWDLCNTMFNAKKTELEVCNALRRMMSED